MSNSDRIRQLQEQLESMGDSETVSLLKSRLHAVKRRWDYELDSVLECERNLDAISNQIKDIEP